AHRRAQPHPCRAALIAAMSIFPMPIIPSNAGFASFAAGSQHLGQHAWRDLPGDAPLVFAPTALALLATITDDGVPVAVGLLLIVGGDLEREVLVVLDRGTAVEADTGDARDRELDRQHVALPARWVVAGCTVNGTYRAIGKGLGIKARSCLGVFVIS